MQLSPTPRPLTIQSAQHTYTVEFVSDPLRHLERARPARRQLVVDRRLLELHPRLFADHPAERIHAIDAHEDTKSLAALEGHLHALMQSDVRRGDLLVSVGGGVTQDLTSFIASILYRGLDWECIPTTLLAQADSCIGSKTSLNFGHFKNALGSFHPPLSVCVDVDLLETLSDVDLRSGLGEILKVHILAGPETFSAAAAQRERWLSDRGALRAAIRRALEIKRPYCERDERDRGVRLLLNYGHTFGHAIEAASGYRVPHGIAVTLGMDLANEVAHALGRISKEQLESMRPTLRANARGFERPELDRERFWTALCKDKKNRSGEVHCILLDPRLRAERVSLPADGALRSLCEGYWGHGG